MHRRHLLVIARRRGGRWGALGCLLNTDAGSVGVSERVPSLYRARLDIHLSLALLVEDDLKLVHAEKAIRSVSASVPLSVLSIAVCGDIEAQTSRFCSRIVGSEDVLQQQSGFEGNSSLCDGDR